MTNGEKIEEIFPNLEISPDPYSPSIDIYVGNIMMMRVDRNWWNAEYKELTTKNNLGVDCISRQAVLDLINADWKYENLEIEINNLPSVTPQERKTGHWVNGEYCSECGCDVPAYIVDWKWQKDMDAKYCPNCGCRMVEPQESEDN